MWKYGPKAEIEAERQENSGGNLSNSFRHRYRREGSEGQNEAKWEGAQSQVDVPITAPHSLA